MPRPLSTSTEPPAASTAWRTRERPRPLPGIRRASAFWPRKKGSKRRGRSSLAIPGPRSVTARVATAPRPRSPTVSVTWLWISLIGFIALYGTLGTVDLILMLRYSREQLPPPREQADASAPLPAVQY